MEKYASEDGKRKPGLCRIPSQEARGEAIEQDPERDEYKAPGMKTEIQRIVQFERRISRCHHFRQLVFDYKRRPGLSGDNRPATWVSPHLLEVSEGMASLLGNHNFT